MLSPLQSSIALNAEDEEIAEGSLLVPMWHLLVVYPSTVSGPLE